MQKLEHFLKKVIIYYYHIFLRLWIFQMGAPQQIMSPMPSFVMQPSWDPQVTFWGEFL